MESMESKMRSTDRKLVLRPMTGGGTDNRGMTDSRLFTGENVMHLKMDPQTCFWSFSYDKGVTPEHLKQKFTGFKAALKFVDEYYRKRNVEIVEVKD